MTTTIEKQSTGPTPAELPLVQRPWHVARFLGLMLGVPLGVHLIARVSPAMSGTLAVGLLVWLVVAAPALGIRRGAVPILLVVPLVNAVATVVLLWRVAALPQRYWADSMWPRQWRWYSVIAAGLALVALAVGVRDNVYANGWGDSVEKAALNGGRDHGVVAGSRVVERSVARRVQQREGVLVTAVARTADGASHYRTVRVRSSRKLFGTDWSVDEEFQELSGPICVYHHMCVYVESTGAASLELLFYERPSVTLPVLNGVAYWFAPEDLGLQRGKVVRDGNGRVLLENRPPPLQPVVPAGAGTTRVVPFPTVGSGPAASGT